MDSARNVSRWQPPGPSRFVDTVLGRLDGGQSVGIVCPEGGIDLSVGWWKKNLDRHYGFGVVDLTHELESSSLCRAVAETSGLPHQDGHWDVFREVDHIGCQCFLVDARFCQESGIEMLEQHAREVNALDPVDRSRLVVLLGVDGLREDDGRWIRLDWLGVVTRADTLALVESLGLYDTIKAEMISELALWDLDLVEELVSDWDFSVDGAVALLESGVKSEPDAADRLKLKWSVGNRSEHRVNPQLFSSGLQQLWAGAVRTHIQMDDGRPLQERVQKAMWLGQVRAIFPELERHRLEIAQHAQRSARSSGKSLDGISTEEILHLEIPDLRRCVKNNPAAVHLGQTVMKRLEALYGARNSLAHQECVAPRHIHTLGL